MEGRSQGGLGPLALEALLGVGSAHQGNEGSEGSEGSEGTED